MKKPKKEFTCKSCGEVFRKWQGQCPDCENWNTIEETGDVEGEEKSSGFNGRNLKVIKPDKKIKTEIKNKVIPLSRLQDTEIKRISTGLSGFDLLLGGGMVPGSVILIGGEPGVGKSTLLLEVAKKFPGKVFYFSGEESTAQIKLRASRLGAVKDHIYAMAEGNAENILSIAASEKPDLLIVDSIQTIYHPELKTNAGSPVQVREAALYFMDFAKHSGIPVILVGHITKEGQIAGPKLLEHIVDTVMYFEGDRFNYYRLLRTSKNRFGAIGEIAIFEMKQKGLQEVLEPSAAFLQKETNGQAGACFGTALEGSRALALEVQALVTRASYANARRMADGMDSRRLMLLSAVLEKFLELDLSGMDLYLNIAGGLSVSDPGLDLAIAVAILSSYRLKSVPQDLGFIGELGLQGEIRPVSQIILRLKELNTLAVKKIYIPRGNLEDVADTKELKDKLIPIGTLQELSDFME